MRTSAFAAGPGRGYGKLNFLLRNSVRPGSQISQISSKRARSGREVFGCGKDRYWRLRGCRMRAWNPYWMSAHLRIVGPRTEGSDMKKGILIRVVLGIAAMFALAWLPQVALAQHGGGHGGGGGFHGGGGG